MDPWAESETVLALRTCKADGSSHNGYRYDMTPGAIATAPDWDPTPQCGGGLHVLVEADGDWSLLDWSVDAKALIVRVRRDELVRIDHVKAKVPRLRIEKVTTLPLALCELACDAAAVNRIVDETLRRAASGEDMQLAASGEDVQLAASGEYAQLAASGDGAQLAASGYGAKLAASGNGAKLAASGYGAKFAASGYGAKLAASGERAKLTASGNGAQLAASGEYAQLAASGDGAQLAASGEDAQLAASGNGALILAGYSAVAQAGPDGCLALAWWDGTRPRVSVGYVGEGLTAGVWYRVNARGEFEKKS